MTDNSLNITKPVDGTNNITGIIPANNNDHKEQDSQNKKKKTNTKRTPISEELNNSRDELENDGPGIDFHA